MNLKRKSAVSILIGSVQIRQWARVPDSALPARTLALLVQQALPSKHSVRRGVGLGKSRGWFKWQLSPVILTGV